MGCVESTGATGDFELASGAGSPKSSLGSQGADFHEHYAIGGRLLEGSFGEVRYAEHLFYKAPVAVKVITDDPPSTSTVAGSLRSPRGGRGASPPCSPRSGNGGASPRLSTKAAGGKPDKDVAAPKEVALLGEVGQHRHCIRFYEFFLEQGTCYIVTEFWKESLLNYMTTRTVPTPAPELKRVMAEMAHGVAHVHQVGLLHRNVVPESFVLGGEDGKTVKLRDFGVATTVPKKVKLLYMVAGTPPYMSPEMLGDEGYDQGTDIWSLGATYYEMLYGQVPYCPPGDKSLAKVKAAIVFGVPGPTFQQVKGNPTVVKGVPKAAEDIVRQCLSRDVYDRPGAAKLVEHPFFEESKVKEKLSQPEKAWKGRGPMNDKASGGGDSTASPISAAGSLESSEECAQSRESSKSRATS